MRLFLFILLVLFSSPFLHADEDTPVSHQELLGVTNQFGKRPWRKPDYEGQGKYIGYSANAFSIPKGMEKRVDFWKRIYTELTTEQGLIHHSEDIEKVYRTVDFTDLKNSSLSKKQIDKEKQARVDALKKIIVMENSNLKISDLRFQLGQKDRIETAIFLSGRYIEEFEEIFKQNQMPIELVRLVFVESSFNVLARSKVGASGLWQIMPSNAKPHRMIGAYVDKRNHPLEATKLAAKILKNNFQLLQDWSLAVTGYNHGQNGVLKMTNKYQTRSLPDLIENVNSRKSFGFASRNFYASFLAILDVEKNADKYFKNVSWSEKIPGEPLKLRVSVPFSMFSAWYKKDMMNLQIYNPHLTRRVLSKRSEVPSGTWVNVPQENYIQAMSDLSKLRRRVASN